MQKPLSPKLNDFGQYSTQWDSFVRTLLLEVFLWRRSSSQCTLCLILPLLPVLVEHLREPTPCIPLESTPSLPLLHVLHNPVLGLSLARQPSHFLRSDARGTSEFERIGKDLLQSLSIRLPRPRYLKTVPANRSEGGDEGKDESQT